MMLRVSRVGIASSSSGLTAARPGWHRRRCQPWHLRCVRCVYSMTTLRPMPPVEALEAFACGERIGSVDHLEEPAHVHDVTRCVEDHTAAGRSLGAEPTRCSLTCFIEVARRHLEVFWRASRRGADHTRRVWSASSRCVRFDMPRRRCARRHGPISKASGQAISGDAKQTRSPRARLGLPPPHGIWMPRHEFRRAS
jgi:hypothetical protein